MTETTSIIANSRFKIITALKERKAFDEQSAIYLEDTNVNFVAVLDVMEKSGLICKTLEGKIFMIPKNQDPTTKSLSVNYDNSSNRKFVRFSRNK